MKVDETKTPLERKYEKYVKLRDGQHLTDSKVSEATGVRRSALSDWKVGRSAPNYDNLVLIARFFGVPADYFADDPEEKE